VSEVKWHVDRVYGVCSVFVVFRHYCSYPVLARIGAVLQKSRETTPTMAPSHSSTYHFTTPQLQTIFPILSSLQPAARKSLVTLCRAQVFPTQQDTILRGKTTPILPYIFSDFHPTSDLDELYLTPFGEAVHDIISSPLTTGLLLVLCLELPDGYDTQSLKQASWDKEYGATQTIRSEGKWNWDLLFGNVPPNDTSMAHPDFPVHTHLQKSILGSLRWFRRRVQGKRIFPHYTRKGISKETGKWMLSRIRDKGVVKHGKRSTFFRRADPRNLKSVDVIHYYIRTGEWPFGRVEMRQQWSTNLLVPRTYFAWGGNAIRDSCYVRNLFNDIADLFQPCHRYNRVQPDWLRYQTPRTSADRFYFYDLTSFTSWFHEQTPLLRALARSFKGVTVDLVSEGLTIKEVGVDTLIDAYVDGVNEFPLFYYERDFETHVDTLDYHPIRHLCAGFLGVPGNLVTCTLGHGLVIASTQNDPNSLQVPGDDVGALTRSDEHRMDVVLAAQSVGVLQTEKVYDSEQASVYLKRGVNLTSLGVSLKQFLIYPIPVLFTDPTGDRYRQLKSSGTFKLVDPDRLVPRACQIMTTFHRDLYQMSGGVLSNLEKSLITDFLHYLHAKIGLPTEGIFQGNLVNGDLPEKGQEFIKEVSVKFPLEQDFLVNDPDELFADRYIEVMRIRDPSRSVVTWDIAGGLQEGEIITVRQGKKWSFLRDMGYLEETQKIGGELVIVVGAEAKETYLRSRKPPYTCLRVQETISHHQLLAVGFSSNDLLLDSIVFDDKVSERAVEAEFRNPLRHYRDWDRPTYGGVEVDYDDEGGPTTMMSMGNDSVDILDLY